MRILVIISAVLQAAYVVADQPYALRLMDATPGMAIDQPSPRFAWASSFEQRGSTQSAYQIQVIDAKNHAAWDSGRVQSAVQGGIDYTGPTLNSCSAYTWRVRVWDQSSEPSHWSAAYEFSTAFFNASDWSADAIWISAPQSRVGLAGSNWISPPTASSRTMVSRNFSLAGDSVVSALTTVTGEGSFNLTVNGLVAKRFNGTWEDGVVDLDLKKFLQKGSNIISISAPSCAPAVVLRMEIRKSDESWLLVVTDNTWFDEEGESVTILGDYTQSSFAGIGILKKNGAVNDQPSSFRKEFIAKKGVRVSRATLYIAGLGHFIAYLNGQRIGANIIDPGWSNYDDRVYYVTLDATELIHPGLQNVLGVQLGNGWFDYQTMHISERWGWGESAVFIRNWGVMRMFAQLNIEYEDGTEQKVVSDPGWTTAASPWSLTTAHGSECYDARMEQPGWNMAAFNDSAWKPANIIEGPPGQLQAQQTAPLRVQNTLQGTVIMEGSDFVIFDLGININGQQEITIYGPRNATVTIIGGERIDSNGHVQAIGDSKQDPASAEYTTFSTFTLSGNGNETWRQSFSTSGFRYIEVQEARSNAVVGGQADLPVVLGARGYFVHSDVPLAGSFNSSNTKYNAIYDIVQRTMLSNLVSIHTDCPTYEKLGWQEVVSNLASSYSYIRDVRNYYSVLMTHVRDSQLEDGLVPDIVPAYTAGKDAYNDAPEWGTVIINAPWELYQMYGDPTVLKDNYDAMKKYYAYLKSRAGDNLITYGLGDWVAPANVQVDNVAGAVYVRSAKQLAQIAYILGEIADAQAFQSDFNETRQAYNKAYLSTGNCSYIPNTQADQGLPLAFGIIPDTQLDCGLSVLVSTVTDGGYLAGQDIGFGPNLPNHTTMGDISIGYVLRALSDLGRPDIVENMMLQSTLPAYWALVADGQTSLPENWDYTIARSLNHDMFASIMEWFYRTVAGIKPLEPGFASVAIKPAVHQLSLTEVEATYRSIRGDISVQWEKTASGDARISVKIPGNTVGLVYIPSGKFSPRDAAHFSSDQGLRSVKQDGDYVVVEIGSGNYTFDFDL
ncbi:hypothetical protein N7520_005407 [Penicillium odoratum]|uniref:uncharacterized protein n=1 Tax=Penicillium odoratum TaxID=1167516 RepID=UPI0025468685|nr:uncharacterized protein N7520_005407 [Penicillium odoratum]KAJ5765848.1 hypothetical protein N7520_005407 [Penicillium odoratum]